MTQKKKFKFSVNVECTQDFQIEAQSKKEALRIIKASIEKYGSVNGSGDAKETNYSISDGDATSLDDVQNFEEVRT